MIFYTNNISDVKLIPSSYLVLIVSEEIKTINHPNYLKVDLAPDIYLDDSKENKKKYKLKIKNKLKLQIATIIQMISKSPQANSVVFISCKKDSDTFNFNYLKTLCKYINNRYGYISYEFTNCVTKNMRDVSELSEEGISNLILDLKEVSDAI